MPVQRSASPPPLPSPRQRCSLPLDFLRVQGPPPLAVLFFCFNRIGLMLGRFPPRGDKPVGIILRPGESPTASGGNTGLGGPMGKCHLDLCTSALRTRR